MKVVLVHEPAAFGEQEPSYSSLSHRSIGMLDAQEVCSEGRQVTG